VIWENPHHSDYGRERDVTRLNMDDADTTLGALA
jgi:hypothetical protein